MDIQLQEIITDIIEEGQPCLREWNGDGYNYRCWYCFERSDISRNYPFAITDHKEDCPWLQLLQYMKEHTNE